MKNKDMKKVNDYYYGYTHTIPLTTDNPQVIPYNMGTATNVTVTTTPNGGTIASLNGNANTYVPYDPGGLVGNNTYYQPFPIMAGFDCYASSEGRISQGKLDLIFQLLAETKQTYEQVIKHLGMEERLFNTVLLEYALKFKPRFFIEMISHKQAFTKEELFNQVVKSYC